MSKKKKKSNNIVDTSPSTFDSRIFLISIIIIFAAIVFSVIFIDNYIKHTDKITLDGYIVKNTLDLYFHDECNSYNKYLFTDKKVTVKNLDNSVKEEIMVKYIINNKLDKISEEDLTKIYKLLFGSKSKLDIKDKYETVNGNLSKENGTYKIEEIKNTENICGVFTKGKKSYSSMDIRFGIYNIKNNKKYNGITEKEEIDISKIEELEEWKLSFIYDKEVDSYILNTIEKVKKGLINNN